MQKEEVVVLNIYWEKIEFKNSFLDEINRPSDKGIYQIYGRHNAYGEDALLYIGMTLGNFGERLSERWELIESCSRPTYVRLGRLVQHKNPEHWNWSADMWDHMIGIAEKLLIRAHSPALNKQGTTGLLLQEDIENQHYLILNWEDFGSLLPEVSTFRNSYRFWEFDTPMGRLSLSEQE